MDNVRTLDGMASDDTLYMCCKCCLTTRGRTTAETAVPNLTFAYDELRDAILLVFANQQDFSNALSTIEMAEKLYAGLQTVLSGNCTVMDTEKVCFHKGDCDYTLPSTSAFFATFLLYFIGPLMVMYCSSNPFFCTFCLLVARQRS